MMHCLKRMNIFQKIHTACKNKFVKTNNWLSHIQKESDTITNFLAVLTNLFFTVQVLNCTTVLSDHINLSASLCWTQSVECNLYRSVAVISCQEMHGGTRNFFPVFLSLFLNHFSYVLLSFRSV